VELIYHKGVAPVIELPYSFGTNIDMHTTILGELSISNPLAIHVLASLSRLHSSFGSDFSQASKTMSEDDLHGRQSV
jgi:hypothetical protein